jgi:hypothetical protein
MISDLVTGPFMNGLAQYGVKRGSIHTAIMIDDASPPATIIYKDSNNHLKDEITKQVINGSRLALYHHRHRQLT